MLSHWRDSMCDMLCLSSTLWLAVADKTCTNLHARKIEHVRKNSIEMLLAFWSMFAIWSVYEMARHGRFIHVDIIHTRFSFPNAFAVWSTFETASAFGNHMVGRTGHKREQTYMLKNLNMLLRLYRNTTAFEEHVRNLEHARNSSFIHARLFDACKKKLCM